MPSAETQAPLPETGLLRAPASSEPPRRTETTSVDGLLAVLGSVLTVVTVIGSLELLVLTAASLLPQPRRRPSDRQPSLAVVVPAHDEQAGIGRAVASLRASQQRVPGAALYVVAHNCSDDTAGVAEAAGAQVLRLDTPDQRGKTHALIHGLDRARADGFEAFVVVDADSEVAPDFLEEIGRAFAGGVDAVQTRYVATAGEDPKSRLQALAFAAMNVVRPRGRTRLGLSAGVLGNGFGLSRRALEAVPFEPGSIAEDLDHHLRLVDAGFRVDFVDRTSVRAGLPTSEAAVRVQRSRWEGGRLRVAAQWVPALAGRLLRGRLRVLEPLADLLLLPLGFHVPLLVAAALVPFWPTQVLAWAGLAIVAAHVATALALAGGGMRDLQALLRAPFYVLWKLRMLGAIRAGARKDAEWVRTPRDD